MCGVEASFHPDAVVVAALKFIKADVSSLSAEGLYERVPENC